MKALFLQKYPAAIVETRKNVVYVNGQTAYNTEDVYNSSNWFLCMENALRRAATL